MQDFHVHTHFSFDCDVPMDVMIESAINKGCSTICITDHYDFNYPRGDDFTMNISQYLVALEQMQQRYAQQITIKKGIEIGMDLQYRTEIAQLLSQFTFDYIIGSVHVIAATEFYYGDFFRNKSKWEANQQYFEAVYQCLEQFGQIHTLGHLDYIARYGHNQKIAINYTEHQKIIDQILQKLIRDEIILEINTSGIRQGVGVSFPGDQILERYVALGGKRVVLGSDAHFPQDISANFSTILPVIEQLGLELYAI